MAEEMRTGNKAYHLIFMEQAFVCHIFVLGAGMRRGRVVAS
jgi:hypothetical protein